jgi:hypothetical protein
MKKTPESKSRAVPVHNLRTEYRFDYSKARPNRFAAKFSGEHSVVVLDPDVARVFKTPESVNRVLRALIETVPGMNAPKARRRPSGT